MSSPQIKSKQNCSTVTNGNHRHQHQNGNHSNGVSTNGNGVNKVNDHAYGDYLHMDTYNKRNVEER